MVHSNFKLAEPSLLLTKGWINDEQVSAASGKTFDVIDPANGDVWTSAPAMDQVDTDKAIAAATEAFKSFSQVTARQRARMILKLDELVREHKEDLAQLLVMESGKALVEARAEVDYATTYSWLMAGEAERIQGEAIKANDNPSMRFFTQKVPIGPVALLCPWNFPLVIVLRKMATALAAGCTMVIKPSPETPTTTLALALLAQKAGVPKGVVNVVTASNETTPEVGKKLCEDKRIKKVSFTGSTAIGKLLMSLCAPSLKKMTLELGGNGGWVVFDDAELEKSADALMANKLRHAGQVCVCANRVFVQKGVFDKFAALVEERMRKLKFGHGLDHDSTNGPVTTERGAARAVTLVEDAVNNGGKLVMGGKRFGTGYLFEPTLVLGAGREAQVYREEMFAPIVSLYPFEDEDEVVELCNATDMGLSNYVWTQNISRAWRCFERLESGTVAINTANANTAESPFGGIKESGIGKEGGLHHGVDEFCVIKVAAMTV
ncbi:hypothetical protein CcaverHIS002_0200870 [Cutaneotrichosporon cavernicola]|uniref:Succinate-semialdehyde dehydrogenase, mitochondrial n=1 Tax=Cutaneotrichosporon cavernicola TaxID=279322 RepID=A0AA48L0V8_9TREE|nr:uncharacterized protein CcaverHIS019_0200920 [Cutaneotrichosporon cavernicola]BEI80927.1 hypothetical protein CcaverHIS002_0200870 [Cutaneotrichosporon cavernicola]BEI88730.1 hypothetical protein CcaverHIS019_0200920 [Cutaneotrichosporon cavernicola]BEI96504.1 hypothetical protein CcaverHIS631_0200930 [Cutaneotrichosporon cavernicola]BEJ04275.1 hypothetical protein CcaverHIS641_0200920 [Cutaneotrichosporon cavernicola]